jgi:hypothetical protein
MTYELGGVGKKIDQNTSGFGLLFTSGIPCKGWSPFHSKNNVIKYVLVYFTLPVHYCSLFSLLFLQGKILDT